MITCGWFWSGVPTVVPPTFPFHPHFAISPPFPYLLLNTQQSHPCTTTRFPVAAHQSDPHLCLQTPCCYVHKPAGEFFTVLCVTPLTFTPRPRQNWLRAWASYVHAGCLTGLSPFLINPNLASACIATTRYRHGYGSRFLHTVAYRVPIVIAGIHGYIILRWACIFPYIFEAGSLVPDCRFCAVGITTAWILFILASYRRHCYFIQYLTLSSTLTG